ncbi:MAG: hypothetical protein AABX86_00345 [Nanoarchaeota archaeon]
MVMKHIHTMIERPIEIRKAILEAAVKSTEILRQEEVLKDMRDHKEELKREIGLSLARLKRSVLGIKKALPPLPKDLDVPHPVKPIEVKEVKKREEETEKFAATSRQKMDAEIAALRERIARLQI